MKKNKTNKTNKFSKINKSLKNHKTNQDNCITKSGKKCYFVGKPYYAHLQND